MSRFDRATRLLAVLALLGVACGGGIDPILQLGAEESLERGRDLMERGKYLQAREYLVHAFEVEPNSATGREALLLVADSHYLARGEENFIKAEAKYRDFQNRFPTSKHAAYVQFQIANSLAERIRRPDRDQTPTYKALAAYEDLLRIYPTSEYAAEAEERIREVKDTLARSEYLKGWFHMRSVRLPEAAANRFERVLELYPEYSEMDQVLFQLGRAYLRLEEIERAEETFERLEAEYPESPLIAKIPELPEPPPTPEPSEEEAGASEVAATESG